MSLLQPTDKPSAIMPRTATDAADDALANLANAMPQLVWIADPDGAVVYYNDRVALFAGAQKLANGRWQWEGLLHPDDLQPTTDAWQKACDTGTLYQIEHRVQMQDGSYRWHLSRAQPHLDATGKVVKWYGTATDVHEITVAKEALRVNEEQLRQVTETVPAIIWLTDPTGYCTYLNQHWYNFTGQTKEEAEGFGWLSATHPNDKEKAGQMFTAANEARKSFRDLYRLRNKGGSYRWAIDMGDPRFAPDGTYEGMVGTVVDVHEQQMAQEALRISEDRYQNFVRRSSEGIWRFEVNEPIPANLPVEEQINRFFDSAYLAECNDAMAEMYGYQSAQELVGRRLSDFFPRDEDTEAYFRYFAASGYRVQNAESKEWTKDGSVKFFSNNLIGIIEDGYLLRAWGTQRDITAQRAAEDALRESETHFRQLADSISHIIWTAQPNGFLDYYNQRWYEFTGFAEGYGDQSWIPILHPDDVSICIDTWRYAVQTGEPYHIEYRFKDKSTGGYRWFLGKALPIRDKDGTVTKWFGSCTDIDDQKRFSEKLEATVAERTKELQRSNDDLQQFAHVASHDLKEPVRKIRMFASRLEEEAADRLSDREKGYLEKISSAASRMMAMIEGVLSHSSLSVLEQAPEKIELNTILDHVEADLEVMIAQKKATITREGLPTVEGAPVLIYQLFYNLVVNALKFSRDGVPPIISITAQAVEKDGRNFTKLTIADNGIGFQPEHAHRIFETFTRLHSKDKFEGTGLGLSLCKKIAERHGGSIEAKSGEGLGATFIITLPLSA